MTEKLLNKDFQKQAPGSAILQLFELELSSSSTVYFHAGVEEDLSTVQLRQEDGTIKTYVALPV